MTTPSNPTQTGRISNASDGLESSATKSVPWWHHLGFHRFGFALRTKPIGDKSLLNKGRKKYCIDCGAVKI